MSTMNNSHNSQSNYIPMSTQRLIKTLDNSHHSTRTISGNQTDRSYQKSDRQSSRYGIVAKNQRSISKTKKRSQSRQMHIILSSVCSEEIDEWDLKSSEILVDIDRVGRTPNSNCLTEYKHKHKVSEYSNRHIHT